MVLNMVKGKNPRKHIISKKPPTNQFCGVFASVEIILFVYVLEIPTGILICPINTNICKYH